MDDDIYLSFARLEQEELAAVVPYSPECFLQRHRGDVLTYAEIPDDSEIIGHFEAYYADLQTAIQFGFDANDVIDVYSQTAVYLQLFDKSGRDYSDALEKVFGDPIFQDNVLIIHSIEIAAEYRGYGLGLLLLRWLIERFGRGVGVVAIEPVPLQFGNPTERRLSDDLIRLDQFSETEQAAERKLRKYYRRLGFRSLPRTPLMVRYGDQPLPLPEQLQRQPRRFNARAHSRD